MRVKKVGLVLRVSLLPSSFIEQIVKVSFFPLSFDGQIPLPPLGQGRSSYKSCRGSARAWTSRWILHILSGEQLSLKSRPDFPTSLPKAWTNIDKIHIFFTSLRIQPEYALLPDLVVRLLPQLLLGLSHSILHHLKIERILKLNFSNKRMVPSTRQNGVTYFPIKAPYKARQITEFPNKLAKEVEPAWLHPNMHFQTKPSFHCSKRGLQTFVWWIWTDGIHLQYSCSQVKMK